MAYAPGSRPLDGASLTRRVYLPAGADWFDLATDELLGGGQAGADFSGGIQGLVGRQAANTL